MNTKVRERKFRNQPNIKNFFYHENTVSAFLFDHKYIDLSPLSAELDEFYDANDEGFPQSSVSDWRSPDVEEDPDYVERADISSKFTDSYLLYSLFLGVGGWGNQDFLKLRGVTWKYSGGGKNTFRGANCLPSP